LGRDFDEQKNTGSVKPQDANLIILSDAVWRVAYGGDRTIIGKTVKLNGKYYLVSGVMPRGFAFPFGGALPVVCLPVVLGDKDALRTRNITPNYDVIGRLKSGSSMSDAEAELKAIQAEAAKSYADPTTVNRSHWSACCRTAILLSAATSERPSSRSPARRASFGLSLASM
jgi:hypothetical protein